jgi:hypothetical protein
MKKIVLILILINTTYLFAQNWEFKSGGNVFDGKYKTSSIKGNGTEFPYNNPVLVINLFKEESLNFYIADAGYFQDLSETEVLWIFNNEPNTIYKSISSSKSDDSKTIFFDDFINSNTNKNLSRIEFIEKLKTAYKVNVRIKDNYGKNDLSFSLKGSTKAIDYVVSKKFRNDLITYQKEIKKIAEENIEEQVKINTRILLMLNNAGINHNEWQNLFEKIDYNCDLYDISLKEIDTININIGKYSTNLNLINGNGKILKEIKYVDDIIPQYIEDVKNTKRNTKTKFVKSLLDNYELTENEKEKVTSEIINDSEYHFDIDKLDNLDLQVILKRCYLTLFDKQNNKIHSYNYFETIIPDYVKRTSLKIINNSTERIIFLLKKYELTEIEKNKIFENLAEIYLYKIEKENADIVRIENYPYITRIIFSNKIKEIHQVTIDGKDFSKQLKMKIKKLKLN